MPTRLRSEELFRLAVEGSPAAKIMVDGNGVIEFANATAERLFGYAISELIGQSIDILVPARLRTAHSGLRGGFFSSPSARPMGAGRDLNGVRKDGSEFPVEIALTPIDTASGLIVLATVVDITERRRAEERFRLAVDSSPASMIMVDPNGSIGFANATAERTFGYASDELIGQSIELLVPAQLRMAHAGLRRGFFRGPSARPMGAGRDLNGVRKDGSEFPVEIALTPIESESGPVVFATIVDITERRRAQLELARRANELEIANQRLAQFAYVASHDLQEPLRKIAVYADLLEQAIAKSDHDEVARATRVIAGSAVRARSLVQNLLAFSRATSSETQTQALDLRAEVELALSDLSASIEETRAQVSIDIPPVAVRADRMQLGRLIQNIVSNAIKFHKPGTSPVIAIRAAPAGEAKAELSIVDDGIGFADNFAREIFQPFKRLAGTAEYAGTGIGLAICKAIADRYGWTIGVRSRPGEGATFTVTLPTAG